MPTKTSNHLCREVNSGIPVNLEFLGHAHLLKYERKTEKDSGRSSKMTSSCKWPIGQSLRLVEYP